MNSILELKNVTKSFKEKNVLQNLSFNVKKGETVALIGPNGAGKTTTIDLILGLLKQDDGKITLFQTSPNGFKNAIYQKIGVQFQSSYYPEYITVDEVCQMTSSLYSVVMDYNNLLEEFKLSDKKTQKVGSLSGGERQKLAVMLALINKPEIIFLDELTTGLDPEARRDVWKILQNLQETGITILLTSHYMDEVERLCDRVMILHDKKIVFNGKSQELINSTNTTTLEEAYLSIIKGESK